MRPKLPLDFGETLELAIKDLEDYAGPGRPGEGRVRMCYWLDGDDLETCHVCLAGAPLRRIVLEQHPDEEQRRKWAGNHTHPAELAAAEMIGGADYDRLLALDSARKGSLYEVIKYLCGRHAMSFGCDGQAARIFPWREVREDEASLATIRWNNTWLDNLAKLRPGAELQECASALVRRVDSDQVPECPLPCRENGALWQHYIKWLHDVAKSWKATAEQNPDPIVADRIRRLYDGEQSMVYWATRPAPQGWQFAPGSLE